MSEANPIIISDREESPHPVRDSSPPARPSDELKNSELAEFTKPVPPNKRLQATRWFLTFPQTEVTKEQASERLRNHPQLNQLGIKGYLIAQEKHKDNNHHLHIALWLNKKLSTRNRNYFDFVCEYGTRRLTESPMNG